MEQLDEKEKYLKIQIRCKLSNNLHNLLIVFSKTDVTETHTLHTDAHSFCH